MSKSRPKNQVSRPPPVEPAARRGKTIALIALLVAAAGSAAFFALRGGNSDFETLRGRWLRPDGGYVLEIRSVDSNGARVAIRLNFAAARMHTGTPMPLDCPCY